jgi:hypothetical protein
MALKTVVQIFSIRWSAKAFHNKPCRGPALLFGGSCNKAHLPLRSVPEVFCRCFVCILIMFARVSTAKLLLLLFAIQKYVSCDLEAGGLTEKYGKNTHAVLAERIKRIQQKMLPRIRLFFRILGQILKLSFP